MWEFIVGHPQRIQPRTSSFLIARFLKRALYRLVSKRFYLGEVSKSGKFIAQEFLRNGMIALKKMCMGELLLVTLSDCRN